MIDETSVDAILARRAAIDEATQATVVSIVDAVRREGASALRRFAAEFDGLGDGSPLVFGRDALEAAWDQLDVSTRDLLSRTADRIRTFALQQRGCLRDLDVEIDGLHAGHTCAPVTRAGCYAPGGRYPLPASVLMTAVTAVAAGVPSVLVASPHPARVTLGAAFVSGAEAFVPVGGAQAIAALAYGVGTISRCDVIVGPGNRYVTAAKHLVSRDVGIDMLAGPSELVVIADASADPELVAADLLAQAEHDPDAVPVLITRMSSVADAVRTAVARQLPTLPTADVARAALRNGGVIRCADEAAVVAVCDALAPEHLALHVAEPAALRARVANFGAVFEGGQTAEVLGDYGVGPNHVLPTRGQARHTGGLSVFHFLRVRTHLGGEPSADLLDDACRFAGLEGLPFHARAAAMRLGGDAP